MHVVQFMTLCRAQCTRWQIVSRGQSVHVPLLRVPARATDVTICATRRDHLATCEAQPSRVRRLAADSARHRTRNHVAGTARAAESAMRTCSVQCSSTVVARFPIATGLAETHIRTATKHAAGIARNQTRVVRGRTASRREEKKTTHTHKTKQGRVRRNLELNHSRPSSAHPISR